MSAGIAYTIDPAFENEVREYLGTLRGLFELRITNPICSCRLPRKGVSRCSIHQKLRCQSRMQDGYTLETLDVYGMKDGAEIVVKHNVGPR